MKSQIRAISNHIAHCAGVIYERHGVLERITKDKRGCNRVRETENVERFEHGSKDPGSKGHHKNLILISQNGTLFHSLFGFSLLLFSHPFPDHFPRKFFFWAGETHWNGSYDCFPPSGLRPFISPFFPYFTSFSPFLLNALQAFLSALYLVHA